MKLLLVSGARPNYMKIAPIVWEIRRLNRQGSRRIRFVLVHTGQHYGAECGHILIDYQDSARVCSCGQRGHLEAYASATALVRSTEEALLSDQDSSLRGRLDAGEELTTRMLAEEAQTGDVLSQQLIDETGVYLSAGILSLVHTIDPDAVVLGGAMNFGGHQTDVGRRFLQRIRDRVYARTFPAIAENLIVDYASLGGDAGYLGAAGLAREKLNA